MPKPLECILLGSDCAFTRQAAAGLRESGRPPSRIIAAVPRIEPGSVADETDQAPHLDELQQARYWPRIETITLTNGWAQQLDLQLATPTGLGGQNPSKRSPGRALGMSCPLERLPGILFVLACFPRRLPSWLLSAWGPRWINVHPSALPRYRGPAPEFWQLRDGLEFGTVTVHHVAPGLDEGHVLASLEFEMEESETVGSLSRRAARLGGRLAATVIEQIDDDSKLDLIDKLGASGATGSPALRRWHAAIDGLEKMGQSQDERLATRQTWPTPNDYRIAADWSARRAHRFITALGERTQPIYIDTAHGPLECFESSGYDEKATLDEPFIESAANGKDALWVRMTPGVLKIRGHWRRLVPR